MSVRVSESQPSRRPARVWFVQPGVEHYRVPVMDGLVRRGAGTYEITFLGPLRDGKSTGAIERPYFRHLKYETWTVLGQVFTRWPDVLKMIRHERPDVVIVAGSPRSTTCWRLPGVCRKINAVPAFWSKVHSFSGVPSVVMSPLKRKLYSGYELAICYGKLSRDELVAEGFPTDRIYVAQNTIDTRRIFQEGDAIAARGRQIRAEAGLDGRRIVLCVGRMDREKRHDDLLTAWPRLREIDSSLALVFVGGGPRLEEIRSAARDVDPDRVIVTGRVPEGDDYAWIAASDFAIFPGAVGLAINQSMAFGVPTIIADEIGADTEILEHDLTGWRYPPGHINALVQTFRRVCGDDAMVNRVTEYARRRMREEVTIENMVYTIDAAIRRALELKHA